MRRWVVAVLLIALGVLPGLPSAIHSLRAAPIQEGVVVSPTGIPMYGLPPINSTTAESSHILCSTNCNLYGITVTIGATSGWLLLFDALAAPADGAGVTPIWWFPVNSGGTTGGLTASWSPGPPLRTTTGLVAVFSTTGPFTKTASATAAFSAAVYAFGAP